MHRKSKSMCDQLKDHEMISIVSHSEITAADWTTKPKHATSLNEVSLETDSKISPLKPKHLVKNQTNMMLRQTDCSVDE